MNVLLVLGASVAAAVASHASRSVLRVVRCSCSSRGHRQRRALHFGRITLALIYPSPRTSVANLASHCRYKNNCVKLKRPPCADPLCSLATVRFVVFAYDMRGHGRSPGKRSFFDRIEVRLEAGTTGVATVACAGALEAGASRRPTVDPLATVSARSVVTTVAVCRLRVRR